MGKREVTAFWRLHIPNGQSRFSQNCTKRECINVIARRYHARERSCEVEMEFVVVVVKGRWSYLVNTQAKTIRYRGENSRDAIPGRCENLPP